MACLLDTYILQREPNDACLGEHHAQLRKHVGQVWYG